MNSFFEEPLENQDKPEMPERLYARTIDFFSSQKGGGYVLFDAVDAEWFDQRLAEYGSIQPSDWGELIEDAPIYAVEISADQHDNGSAASWLQDRPERPADWVELTIKIDSNGPADLYRNIEGPPQRVHLDLKPAKTSTTAALRKATQLTASNEGVVEAALPSAALDRVVVLDVGQGSANAVYNDAGEIVAYVDLGAGILKNSNTWPKGLTTGFCLCHKPTIILTHWHYDHFHGANKFKLARNRTWIAPLQAIGPGPQSAMANAIMKTGTLLIWNGSKPIAQGGLTIELCGGPAGDFDRTGIAVWADGPGGADPILLPGDAHYTDVPSHNSRTVSSLVVSHHGGDVGGSPPPKPGTRLAFSYGDANTYGHPRALPVQDLKNANWKIGLHPTAARMDERVTCEFRQGSPGTLGNIRLDWPTSARPPRSCGTSACGATVDHNQ
ncbi:MBL fold metallo-hydrolase [Bosea sp. (in: a-proteobacteria)]|jgi:hypothetical protein|uniref:MBL fold metallo-hydrolase n=1 Tax=Bosea sp. (in: a-proteobacteria) TaxID=1871050 RepID=UPI0035656BB0